MWWTLVKLRCFWCSSDENYFTKWSFSTKFITLISSPASLLFKIHPDQNTLFRVRIDFRPKGKGSRVTSILPGSKRFVGDKFWVWWLTNQHEVTDHVTNIKNIHKDINIKWNITHLLTPKPSGRSEKNTSQTDAWQNKPILTCFPCFWTTCSFSNRIFLISIKAFKNVRHFVFNPWIRAHVSVQPGSRAGLLGWISDQFYRADILQG